MPSSVELRLPRHLTISLGQLKDTELTEVRAAIAEATKAGHGVLLAEHKRMQMVDNHGIATGVVLAELMIIQAADPAATLVRYRTAPPDGVQVIALVPAGMLAKAVIATVPTIETEAAKA